MLVLVYADRSNVLLLRRVQPFDFWQSVTGSLHDNEPPERTAARELLEETGIVGGPALEATGISRTFTIDPRWRDRYAPGVTENLEHEYRLQVPVPADVRLDLTEHSEFAWVDIDQAIERVWSWTNREALERLREKL